MRHRFVVMVVVVLVGMVTPAMTAGAARPDDLVCGQTITTSVRLRADLTCSGDGLIITADNVTVDLAGHSIASADGTGAGIRVGAPADPPGSPACAAGAEVTGGSVSGFVAGIAANACWSSGPRVSGMTLTGNIWGVDTRGASGLEVDRTTIVGPNGIGGPLVPPSVVIGGSIVTRSSIRVTRPTGYSVMGQFGSPDIRSSRLDGGRVFVSQTVGFVEDSRLTGVTIGCSDTHVSVTNNRLIGGGIGGSECGYAVSANRFVGPGSGTAFAARGTIYPTEITDNHFTGWDTAVSLDGPGNGMSTRATITGNTFRRNGIGVSGERANLVGTVSANSFLDNSGTGVLLRIGRWNVGSNTALRNGGLGIDAQGPFLTVIDDGGNIARRNLPPQCIGVVCSSH